MGEVTLRRRVEAVHAAHRRRAAYRAALSRVNFTVRDGEIVALIGPSGCGKTTALRIAMGLETASGGKVTVDGREVKGCGHDRGMVFQFAELLPWLSALQNVMFGLEMKGMRGAAAARDRDRAISSSWASAIHSTAARISFPAA